MSNNINFTILLNLRMDNEKNKTENKAQEVAGYLDYRNHLMFFGRM